MRAILFLKKIFLFVSFYIVLCFLLSRCNEPVNSSPCGGIDPLRVPAPPYYNPIWHPSGLFIGFNHTPLRVIDYSDICYPVQRFQGDSTGFWLINVDGTEKRRILPHTLQTPEWSPDGEWIAFVSGAQIFKMKFTGNAFDTTTIVQLTKFGRNFFPSWSPDGQMIAYDSNDKSVTGLNFIWTMKKDGSSKKRINYEPSEGEIRMPCWSSDGRKITHIRFLNGVQGSEIFIMDSSGNNPIRITLNTLDDRYPKYSHNGLKIAFLSNNTIWSIDTLGKNLRQLVTEGVGASSGVPFSWKPNDFLIVYSKYSSNDWTYKNGTLWILDTNTGEKKQLTYNYH